jgi:hypothetical protein
MKPQEWTPRHQSLKNYLIDVVKLPAETFRFGDSHGSAEGKIDDIVSCTLLPATDPNALPSLFQNEPEPELRFTNEMSIHLIIKEFDGVLTFFIAQLLFWLKEEKQDIEFEYKVYWNNETSLNMECFLEIVERGKGSASTGFNVY